MPSANKTAVATNKAPAPAKAVATAKKAAAPVKAATATKQAEPVTTKAKTAAQLAEGHDLDKKQTEVLLGDFVTLATQHLTKGDKIRLSGLSILQVRSRETRIGRNPATGDRRPANPSRSRPARRSRSGRQWN